jgi:hypothetical protein
MDIDAIIATMRATPARHTAGDACEPAELDALEARLGGELSLSYREFIERLGPGIFYERHEIFGPRRVMLHDIEFVPDIFSVTRVLESSGQAPPARSFPVHREGQTVHYLELGRDGRVRSPDGASYSDFAAFLEAVVLPSS